MTSSQHNLKDDAGSQSSQPRSLRSRLDVFHIPPPLKRLFNQFPLRSYPANSLPLRSPHLTGEPLLYVFTTSETARRGGPSFNPSCLRWQAYLLFNGVAFQTVSSNNHASPSGSLPFLISPASPSSPITANGLIAWLRSQRIADSELSPSSAYLISYESLVASSIRLAYLYAIYVDLATFETVAARLYIRSSSQSRLVQELLSHPLRKAALEEILNAGNHQGVSGAELDPASLLTQANDAFGALSALLGESDWFSAVNDGALRASEPSTPGMLDAIVFSYSHVILEFFGEPGVGKAATNMAKSIHSRPNLIAHHERIMSRYFGSSE